MNSDLRHPRWWALVFSALTATACSAAPPPKPPEAPKPTVSLELFNEYSDPGVVVIAPSSDNSDDPLLDIQLDMAQHATRSGPVLIMVSDARSRNLILGACRKFPDICKAMQKGTLRVAMDANAKVLQQHGYRVLRVGALLPRIDLEAGIYYPTVLNALVRVDGNGRRHVMLPTYTGYQEDLQSAAVDKLRAAFKGAEVVTIEATEAAKRQGAVHCLSLVIPSRLSIFSDGATTIQVERMLAVIGEMQQNRDTARERLLGNWRSQGDDGVRFVFGKDGDGLILGDGGIKVIRYSIRTAGTVLAVSTDGESAQYQIEWKSPRHVRLVPSSKAPAIELVRATE